MLDWGLGHTTRCIPILQELAAQGFQIDVACTENQKAVLEKEVNNLRFHIIKGYNITYSTSRHFFSLKIASQIPKMIRMIRYEQKWLKQYVKSNRPDAVITDNRPGFRTKDVLSIYMTHQLSPKTGNKLSDVIAATFHRFFIKKFDTCWIPDGPQHQISGALSKTSKAITNTRYIGPLSRFRPATGHTPVYDLACVLSGPEPQRSLLETILLGQLKQYSGKTIFVRGTTDTRQLQTTVPATVKVVDYLPASQLSNVIQNARLIICRSGYSSIMDLIRLGARAVLIPTPGQGEQEYLAQYMHHRKHFMTAHQHNIDVKEIVDMSCHFSFSEVEVDFERFKTAIADLKADVSTANAGSNLK